MSYALPLADCAADQADLVGGKAVGLGHLMRLLQNSSPLAGEVARQGRWGGSDAVFDVPSGFVITTRAYSDWLAARALGPELERLLATGEAASNQIRALFEATAPTDELATALDAAYAAIGEGLVAVRSSATAEDSADASFAGQQESYLGLSGLDAVVAGVVRCWASLFTPQAISYRARLAVPAERVAMAVVVQRMVAAEASGVMLTIDPVTGDRSQVTIEAVHGLGPPLVGGELTPDLFAVDKVTREVRSQTIATKPFAERIDPATGAVRRVDLPDDEAAAPSLRDDEVVAIAELGRRIEGTMAGAVDVEWAIGPGPSGPRHLYLLQARPETVWSGKQKGPVAPAGTTAMDRILSSMLGRRT